MFYDLLKSVFGSHNDRIVKRYLSVAQQVNAIESDMLSLSDDDFPAKTNEFRQRLADGETLDDLLVEPSAR